MPRKGGKARWLRCQFKLILLWLTVGALLTLGITWSFAIWERPKLTSEIGPLVGIHGEWGFQIDGSRGVGTATCVINYGRWYWVPHSWDAPEPFAAGLNFSPPDKAPEVFNLTSHRDFLNACDLLPLWTTTYARARECRLPQEGAYQPIPERWYEYNIGIGIPVGDAHFLPEYIIHEKAAGWPRLCLRSSMTATGGLQDGLYLPKRLRERLSGVKGGTLPCGILRQGLLINILFYTTLFASLHLAARHGRRMLRRSCGQCPMCKYDLRGDLNVGCPECGWGRDDAADTDTGTPV